MPVEEMGYPYREVTIRLPGHRSLEPKSRPPDRAGRPAEWENRPMDPIAWIKVIEEAQAGDELRQAYEQAGAARGRVANILKVHSLQPRAMTAHLRLYLDLLFGQSDLSRADREMIAVAVSSANHCHYCIEHHGEALRTLTKDVEWVATLKREPATMALSQRQRVLVDYALTLTLRPSELTEADVAKLRAVGLSDAAIHDAAAIAAYFNFVNRLALGLGVALESGQESSAPHRN